MIFITVKNCVTVFGAYKCHIECGTVVRVLQKPAPTIEISANSLATHIKLKRFRSSFQFCWYEQPFKKKTLFFWCFSRFLWTSKALIPWEIGLLGCRFKLFGLYLPSKLSHCFGNQQKPGTLQESVTPVQSFVAETYFIPTVIIKGPQLISETNILLLISRWWRLHTDIRTAYACVCGNESVHV